jgi:hypothetical protein
MHGSPLISKALATSGLPRFSPFPPIQPQGIIHRVNDKFAAAIARFDAENSRDPNQEDGQPRELLYAQRLTEWVNKLCPQASEPLRLMGVGVAGHERRLPRAAMIVVNGDREGLLARDY